MGYPRQEYWSGLQFPPPGIFPTQEDWIPMSCVSCIAGRFITTEPSGKPPPSWSRSPNKNSHVFLQQYAAVLPPQDSLKSSHLKTYILKFSFYWFPHSLPNQGQTYLFSWLFHSYILEFSNSKFYRFYNCKPNIPFLSLTASHGHITPKDPFPTSTKKENEGNGNRKSLTSHVCLSN